MFPGPCMSLTSMLSREAMSSVVSVGRSSDPHAIICEMFVRWWAGHGVEQRNKGCCHMPAGRNEK